MSDLFKERVLVILALILCIAVSIVAAWDAPDLSPIRVVYPDSADNSVIQSKTASNVSEAKTASKTSVITEPSYTYVSDTEKTTDISVKRVNINTAGKDLLETLPGIGSAYAERIIIYRDTYGGFDSIEEIMNVSGIGEKRYAAIRDLITVD